MTFLFAPRLRFTLKTLAASAILTCASGQISAQTAVDTRTGVTSRFSQYTFELVDLDVREKLAWIEAAAGEVGDVLQDG